MTGQPRCKARARTGGQCKNRAVAGGTVCRFHGGRAPQVAAKAAARIAAAEAAEAARVFGLPVETDPQTAIIQELHRTAGVVAWLDIIVRGLEQDRIVNGVTKIETRTGFQAGRSVTVEGKPNAWVDLWQTERRHLVQVSAAAHKMGIDVQQTKLMETAAQMLAAAIMRILDQLTLTEAQQLIAGTVVPQVLRSLEPAEAAA